MCLDEFVLPKDYEKTCATCKIAKPRECFQRSAENRDGLKYSCKECTKIYRANRLSNPEKRQKANASSRKYHHNNKKLINSKKAIYDRNNIDRRRIRMASQSSRWKQYSQEYYKINIDRWEKYVMENKESIAANQRKRYDSNRERILWSGARGRAKKNNLPFDIEVEDVKIPALCPVFGIPFNLSNTIKNNRSDSPSIDRIIPIRGYTKGNIEVISYRANMIKRDASLDELKKLVAWMESRIDSPGS
jgi:hypothetical protein